MPNYNAHTYFGQQVLQSLPLELRQSCTKDLPLFRLGLYGPDPLIFSYLTKASADRLHHHWREESLPRLERAMRQDGASNASFAAGYLLHQILDDATHPQIYQYMEADGSSHFRLEIELDRMILQEQGCPRLPGMTVRERPGRRPRRRAFCVPQPRPNISGGCGGWLPCPRFSAGICGGALPSRPPRQSATRRKSCEPWWTGQWPLLSRN